MSSEKALAWFVAIVFAVWLLGSLLMEARTRQRKDEHAEKVEKRVDDVFKAIKERRQGKR